MKILQIMPADHYWIKWRSKTSAGQLKVGAFALVEVKADDGSAYTEVVPLIADFHEPRSLVTLDMYVENDRHGELLGIVYDPPES
jgi:hypothetical protein